MKLSAHDFPITAVGNRVYARSQSSPIATAWDDDMAQEIALRLNRDDCSFPCDDSGIQNVNFGLLNRL